VLASQAKQWTIGQTRMGFARAGIYTSPSLLIIGAQKCGTGALFDYLCKHPDVIPGNAKEIGFFSHDLLYQKGLKWYHSQFPLPLKSGKRNVTLDATPEYIFFPEVPERIYNYNRNIKMILILRDPVERAYSAWNMLRRRHKSSAYVQKWFKYDEKLSELARRLLMQEKYPSFEEAVSEEINGLSESTCLWPGFVRRGMYADQIERYLRYFDRKQIMIIKSQRLRNETNHVLDEVALFWGLESFDWSFNESERHHNVGEYGSPINPETKKSLAGFYQPHNERLTQLLGIDFG
jgi:hypothetical protein